MPLIASVMPGVINWRYTLGNKQRFNTLDHMMRAMLPNRPHSAARDQKHPA
jgi:hypothetical protein